MSTLNIKILSLACASLCATVSYSSFGSDEVAGTHAQRGLPSSCDVADIASIGVPSLDNYVNGCDTNNSTGGAENTLGVVLEHVERSNIEDRLQPFGNGILGDTIDLNSGSVNFSYTDISIPGNSSLPVALTRKRSPSYVNEAADAAGLATLDATSLPKTYTPNELGDWRLDIPRVTWKFPVPLSNSGAPQGAPQVAQDFCLGTTTYSVAPYFEGAPSLNESVIPHYSITAGMNVSLPGKGESKFLRPSATAKSGLALPATILYITKDYWTASCVMANNQARGLLVKTPDGTQYLFNKFVAAPATSVSITNNLEGESVDSVIPRITSTLLVSKITDKHGNYVDYTYNNDAQVTTIEGNDGRKITLQYNSDGSLLKATANGREFTYGYGTTSNNNRYLTSVTRPDGKQWKISFNSKLNLQAKQEIACSTPTATWSIEHPNGLKGDFTFEETKHIKVKNALDPDTPYGCSQRHKEPANVQYYKNMSLTKKRLSGPVTQAYEWKYQYSASGLNTKTTTVTSPDGSRVMSTYYVRENTALEGLIKHVSYVNPIGIELQRTTNKYSQEGRLGFAFLDNENAVTYEAQRVLTEETQKAVTDTYTTTHSFNSAFNANYSFAKPVKTYEKNSANSYSRSTTFAYENRKAKWVLGVLTKQTVNNKERARQVNNAFGDPTSIYKNGALTASLEYDTATVGAKGTLKSVKNALNRKWTITNYKRGVPTRIGRPDGRVTTQDIDNNGWLTKDTDFTGACTRYRHDSIGRLTLIDPCDSKWANTSIGYSYINSNLGVSELLPGMLAQNITQGGAITHVYYDALQRPIVEKQTDMANTNSTRYTVKKYDHNNKATFAGFAAAAPQTSDGIIVEYDSLGRKTSEQDTVMNSITRYAYTAGNKVVTTNPLGNATTTQYLAYGKYEQSSPLKIESPENIDTELSYNNDGELFAISQDGIQEKRYYDSRLRLCKVVRPDIGNTAFGYDNANQMTFKEHGARVNSSANCSLNGGAEVNRLKYEYNSIGMLTFITTNNGPTQSFKYDNNGRVTEKHGGASKITYSYNSLGLVEDETLSIDGKLMKLDYVYNALGHVSSLIYPSTERVDFTPNAYGEPTKAGSYATNAKYHPTGQLMSHTYGNNFEYTATFLNNGILNRILDKRGGSNIAVRHMLSYDKNKNVTAIDDLRDPNFSIGMTYDNADRLKNITKSHFGTGSLSYDAMGNILKKSMGNQSIQYHYHSSNKRLMSVSNAHVASYAYDDRGNVIGNGRNNFTYNAYNQMSVNGNSYVYDTDNKRVKAVESGKTSYSFYATNGKLMYRLADNLFTDYIYLGGKLVAKVEQTLNTPPPSTGTVTARNHYKPFGETLGTTPDDVGFTGHKFDADIGLSYMQARYYDPVIGRFYSNDPVDAVGHLSTPNGIHGFNRYAYANNNPYKYNDPDGRSSSLAMQIGVRIASNPKTPVAAAKLAGRATLAGGAALADSPAPGPGDVIAVGILAYAAGEFAVEVFFEGESDAEDLSAEEIAAIEKENKQDAIDKAFEDYQNGDATSMDGDDIGRNTKSKTEKDLGYDEDNE
ncbi:RHS repeat-associated core domain-containing protein [Glaciecola siphonariae]|uniref:RHS repeat-associated core domain-containing protein n=1 Tax=Glaciecola siphonariae TaxID=521012 RepID=A0ABV9M047_9ALTE